MLTADCGGGSGTGSGMDGSVSIPSATCDSLTCPGQVDDLLMNCMASGACTKQTMSTGNVRCFGNGVKVLQTGQTASGATGMTSSVVVTAKKGETVCYSKTFAASRPTSGGASAAASTMTVQNGSGAIVATVSGDGSGAQSVTCPGGVPTKVDDACVEGLSAYLYISGTPSDCTEGTCTF